MYLTSPLPFRHQREPHMPKPLDIPALTFPHRNPENHAGLEIEPHPLSSSLPPPTPPPPRSPLPPHKLAKLANALGVNTPMPAFYRSPSPSGSGAFARTPSRYLLHIVPPTYLPSDDDDDGQEPDGASSVPASSYRSQFRRGTLVPLYPTLQSQLGAIAREYNLPSTGGLVLYLLQSSQDGAQDGPRISDDVWKLLWYKALQAERQDSQPRSASTLNLRSGRSTPSSPFNTQLREASQQPLSATSHAPPFPYPSPLSASTPSSEIHLPLSDKDNASSSDALSIASDITPNPFLPILAKVEFDIDRRKASWYDAWAHGKRERSRWRSANDGGKLALELPERARSNSSSKRKFLIDASPPSSGSDYAMLDDGEGDKTAVEEDEATVVLHRRDPLADVFGPDAATWSEMHAGRQRNVTADSSYPELVFPPSGEDAEAEASKVRDEDEVIKLWDENKRPRLPVIPPDIRASPRKGAPPPLDLNDNSKLSPSENGSGQSRSSALPYLKGNVSDSSSSPSEQYSEKWMKRRTGMVFGDLEVKIVAEPEGMTEQELSGRSSQIILKHKLDQLEKQIVQVSPRHMKTLPPPVPHYSPESLRSAPPERDKFDLPPTPTQSKSLRTIPPISRRLESSNTPTHSTRPADDPPVQVSSRKESVSSSSQTQSLEHRRAKSSQSLSGLFSRSQPEQSAGGTRPLVPVSAVAHLPPSPPIPPQKGRSRDGSISQSRLGRTSPGVHRSSPADDALPSSQTVGTVVSPTIPDTFSRRPSDASTKLPNESTQPMSTETRSPPWSQDSTLPASVPEDAELDTQSSRFSADSEQGIERLSKQKNPRVMSVRGLRNLWRKSGVPSNKSISPPLPADLSPLISSTQQPLFQHSRRGSVTSQRSQRSAMERTRRPSLAPRPDSDTDPFQFDNSNIYKSPSSSSLASSAINSATSSGSSGNMPVTPTGSIGPQSKGILKSRSGSVNHLLSSSPSDAETPRKLHRPGSANRSMSTASASLSDLGERSVDSHQSSSPPSSPPDARHTITPITAAAMRRKQTPSPSNDSHSLPTTAVTGLSRYPQPFPPSSARHFDDGATPRLTDFEILPPPTRSTPSSSYTGEVF